jgi:CO dehydrogenase/acetyl-CoA synthase gamma subunit (corrinoid Fe-S protein)
MLNRQIRNNCSIFVKKKRLEELLDLLIASTKEIDQTKEERYADLGPQETMNRQWVEIRDERCILS